MSLKRKCIAFCGFLRKYPPLVLPLVWLVFSVLIILVNCIPDRFVKQSIEAGINTLTAEGDHPWIFFTPQSQLDNFTDRIMLQMSQRTSSWNAVTQYFSKSAEWPELEANSLHNPVFAAFANQGYPRYWHGYTVFLKPLLSFLSLEAIRSLSFLTLLILLCCAFYVLKTRFNLMIACVYCVAISMINIFIVPLSLVYSPVVYLTILSIIGIRYFCGRNRFLLFLLVGAFVNYVDFLTFPLLSLCFPLALVVVHDVKNNESFSRIVNRFIISGIMWLVGYASTWGVKWVLSSLITGRNVVKDAFVNILIRSDAGSHADADSHFDKIETIRSNYECFFKNYPIRLLALIILIVFVLQIFFIRQKKLDCLTALTSMGKGSILLLLAVAPVVWYFCLANHSTIHMEFYAYKNVSITVFSVLVYLCCLSIQKEDTSAIHLDDKSSNRCIGLNCK